MKKKKITAILLALALGLTTFGGCDSGNKSSEQVESSSETESYSKDVFAMDTYMTLTAYGEESETAVNAAAEEISRIENLVSIGIDSSEIVQINENGSGSVSEDTAYMIARSLELFTKTQGAFDLTIYPVMEAWGFPSEEYEIPGEEELAQLLSKVDSNYVALDEETATVTLQNGAKMDLGGIAKGYTSSRIMEVFQGYDIESAVVSLGGNVQVLGTKMDGSNWNIAIEDPDDTTNYLGVLSIADKAVITSGGYERYFEQDGEKYHHIIDPKTGYPADSGVKSVTIVSADGTLADGLSTALFIMGEEKAETFWKEHEGEFDYIIEDEQGVLYVTQGIVDSFSTEKEVITIQGKDK